MRAPRLLGLGLGLVLGGCGADAVEPDFPADYAERYTEVRDCRSSADHDLHRIRVLADPDAVGPYLDRDHDFPEGAVIVKEEFDFADDDCTGAVVAWTAMRRLADGDWHWQKVDAARAVVSENDSRCIGCHALCGTAPDGFEGTCAVP